MEAVKILIHLMVVSAFISSCGAKFISSNTENRLLAIIQGIQDGTFDVSSTPQPTQRNTTPETVKPVLKIELSVIEVLKLLEQSNGETIILDVLPPIHPSHHTATEDVASRGAAESDMGAGERLTMDRLERYVGGNPPFSGVKRGEDSSQLKRLVTLLREFTSKDKR